MIARRLASLLVLALAGCGEVPVWNVPSANTDGRVQHLVLHFTSENHVDSLRLLTEHSDAPVSAHYLIPDPRDPGWGRDRVVAPAWSRRTGAPGTRGAVTGPARRP